MDAKRPAKAKAKKRSLKGEEAIEAQEEPSKRTRLDSAEVPAADKKVKKHKKKVTEQQATQGQEEKRKKKEKKKDKKKKQKKQKKKSKATEEEEEEEEGDDEQAQQQHAVKVSAVSASAASAGAAAADDDDAESSSGDEVYYDQDDDELPPAAAEAAGDAEDEDFSKFSLTPKPRAVRSEEQPTRLFVGNLPFKVTDDDLRSVFRQCGHIQEITYITDKESGQFYGTAFVEFGDPQAAAKAVKLNGTPLNRRAMRIDFPKTTKSRSSTYSASGKRGSKPLSAKPEGCRTLFLGRLPYNIDDDTVVEFFRDCGTIRDVRWVLDKQTGDFKGCGFVEFEEGADIDKAASKNGSKIMGREIRIDFAPDKKAEAEGEAEAQAEGEGEE